MRGTVFITGCRRGLGRAFVEAFARSGANVVAHARKESSDFAFWIDETASRYGVTITPVYFDLTDSERMKAEVRKLIAARIPINVLVNSAGIAHGGLFQMTPLAKIREVFEVNFFAHVELTQQLLRYMMRCGSASVINIASISGMDLLPGNCAYGVSKAAIIAFTKTLAAEVGRQGVRVNAIAPGLTDTDMAKLMESEAGRNMIDASAMKRLGRPDEIADVAVWLASDNSSFVNGQVIRVDGGGRR